MRKSLLLNKQGKAPMWAVFLIASVLILGGFIGYMEYGPEAQEQIGVEADVVATVTNDCNTQPYITPTVINAINPGTTVTGSSFYVIEEASDGSSTYRGNLSSLGSSYPFEYGSKAKILIVTTNYIDTIVETGELKCGSNGVNINVYATSENAMRIFNTAGNQLTDSYAAGNAVNQSTITDSGSLSMFIDGTNDESTGDLLIVIEGSNTTEIDEIGLSGITSSVTDGDVPEFYSAVAAGSISEAFDVPALLDGATGQYTIKLTAESGYDIGTHNTYFLVTAYSKQAFVDTDGTFIASGVEDSQGTTKYEDTFDYDIMTGS